MEVHVINRKDIDASYPDWQGDDSVVYIGRPSPLGNPFRIGQDGTREDVINKYREWLDSRLASGDEHVCSEFNRIGNLAHKEGGVKLLCWCAPLACHGDVIKEFLS